MTHTDKQEIDNGVEIITDLFNVINQSEFLQARLSERIKLREENETNQTEE